MFDSTLATATDRLTMVAALCIMLGACGDPASERRPGQVAAKVNGDEITVLQVNGELTRLGGDAGGDDKSSARQALDRLIDEQLWLQRAREGKLDRDPQVLLALDQARRQILAQAAVERELAPPRPSAEETKAFYGAHPELFAKRRVYFFHEFAIDAGRFSDSLRNKLEAAKNAADVATALKAQGIAFREASGLRAAEQLPLDMLPKVAAMSKGDVIVARDIRQATIWQLVESMEQPLTEGQAGPMIEQYLTNTKKRELAQNRLKELRRDASIEYLAGYAPAAQTAVPGDASADPPPPAAARDFIDKGVSGLKK